MILTGVFLLAVHPYRGDAHVPGLFTRQSYLGSSILRAVHVDSRAPAFIVLDALSNILAEVFVVRIARAILLIQGLFEIVTRRAR